jgi:hypothetical protein
MSDANGNGFELLPASGPERPPGGSSESGKHLPIPDNPSEEDPTPDGGRHLPNMPDPAKDNPDQIDDPKPNDGVEPMQLGARRAARNWSRLGAHPGEVGGFFASAQRSFTEGQSSSGISLAELKLYSILQTLLGLSWHS